MRQQLRQANLAKAVQDLEDRSLASLQSDIAKLVYLASTRDYSTGRYYHDGLAFQFTNEVAAAALETCHKEAFERLLLAPLQSLVHEVGIFFRATHEDTNKVLEAWKGLEPYRIVIPQGCDPVAREFFFSNIRMALAILERRQAKSPPQDQQSASLPQ